MTISISKIKNSKIKIFAFAVLGLGLSILFTGNQTANAAPVVGFNAGNIISDNVFTNSQTMNPGQILNFLNSKVPSCDTDGTRPATEYGSSLTHAQYAASRGWPGPPYTCLKDYAEGGRSAAQIIYDVSQTFQINPQVLIVLLQKEQSLITDTWPLPVQYKSATGYGCPDTAACDSQYYGFTNQVTWAAKMFRAIMNDSPTWYTPYVLGNNFIRWSPNTSCGGSTVNIQNRATKALYNYTPYQPTQASLDAGYGDAPGDCDAHGNRNFYLYFNDWFGSTLYGNLVRTPENSTVYLVSGGTKYPIGDMNILVALSPLGAVSYVNQTYLDTKTTGPLMGRVLKANDGTIYFFDAGIRLPFSSCAQVAAYGSTCGDALAVDDYLVNQLAPGPYMTYVLRTTSGKAFYMDGTKREILDQASLNSYGASIASANILHESSLNGLALGIPVIADGNFVKSSTDGSLYAWNSGSLSKVNPTLKSSTYLNSIGVSSLSNESLAKLSAGAELGGYVRSSAGVTYILTSAGKLQLTSTTDWQKTFTVLSDSMLAQIPTQGSSDPFYFVKSNSSGTVYLVSDGKKRTIQGWGDLLALNSNPMILTLSDYYINSLATGSDVLGPGSLVKTANNATVYLIDGLDSKIPLNSFAPATELGFTNLRTVSSATLDGYTTTVHLLKATITCGSNQGIAIGGTAYRLNVPGATYMTMSDINCGLLTWKDAPGFILAPNGTIYQISSTQKRPIGGYQRYLDLGGNGSNTIKGSNYILDMYPSGSVL